MDRTRIGEHCSDSLSTSAHDGVDPRAYRVALTGDRVVLCRGCHARLAEAITLVEIPAPPLSSPRSAPNTAGYERLGADRGDVGSAPTGARRRLLSRLAGRALPLLARDRRPLSGRAA